MPSEGSGSNRPSDRVVTVMEETEGCEMFASFEVKSYNQLRFYLALANSCLVFVLLFLAYELVLTERHRETIIGALEVLRVHPLLSGLPLLAGLSGFWGWASTILLRLHDRIHEPWIRKWRAGYDADFILRSLCYKHADNISPDLFERAYVDKRVRRKLMQRLFYAFAGDCTSGHEGSRTFFYTVMWRYWFMALCDLHSLLAIVVFAVYHLAVDSAMSPGLTVGLSATLLVSRAVSNRFLDDAHEITLNQVHDIRTRDQKQFDDELKAVAKELSAWREQT
jgi:hypothetical protein